MKKGKIIVIVAPSGTGKSTLIEKLQLEKPEIKWSVSCTTRARRESEIEGKDYFYIDKETFIKRRDQGEFLEWAQVHSNFYGTLKSSVDDAVAKGQIILLDLDVQGCDLVKKIYGDEIKIIFIEPPSLEELESRLRLRATEPNHVIEERLSNAKKEILRADDYDYKVKNDKFEAAYTHLKNIIEKIIAEDTNV